MEKYINQPLPEELLDINSIAREERISVNTDNEILRNLHEAIKGNKTIRKYYCKRCLPDGTLEVEFSPNIVGYIPRNEVSYIVEEDGNVHLGKCMSRVGLPLQFKVKDVEKNDIGKIKVILSRRDALIEDIENYTNNLKEGMVIKGVVSGIQDHAAFIDVGADIKAFLSVKDIARVFVKNPSEILQIGQVIDVVVKEINKNNEGNISLKVSRKELLPSWDNIDEKYMNGETVIGKVKNITDTGIFVQLDESFEGMADFPLGKRFNYGDSVRVKILKINKTTKKIRLRIV